MSSRQCSKIFELVRAIQTFFFCYCSVLHGRIVTCHQQVQQSKSCDDSSLTAKLLKRREYVMNFCMLKNNAWVMGRCTFRNVAEEKRFAGKQSKWSISNEPRIFSYFTMSSPNDIFGRFEHTLESPQPEEQHSFCPGRCAKKQIRNSKHHSKQMDGMRYAHWDSEFRSFHRLWTYTLASILGVAQPARNLGTSCVDFAAPL